ncbi:hypothetical protein TorRG33x02_316380, partial [Trema orientale]
FKEWCTSITLGRLSDSTTLCFTLDSSCMDRLVEPTITVEATRTDDLRVSQTEWQFATFAQYSAAKPFQLSAIICAKLESCYSDALLMM